MSEPSKQIHVRLDPLADAAAIFVGHFTELRVAAKGTPGFHVPHDDRLRHALADLVAEALNVFEMFREAGIPLVIEDKPAAPAPGGGDA